MKKKIGIIVLLLFSSGTILSACTTAVVSGRGTPDGRPLLFKHRDTGELQNRLMVFTDGRYDYIGLVNSPDAKGDEVWAGTNSAGFAVMNSASYNLNENDTTSLKDREGELMKLALQFCTTVEDFQTLLDTLPKPLGVEANFGVIDADGGAAYFETANFDYTIVDVNDPQTAPFGYVIRTNHSFARDQDKGYGYIRYATAEDLFYRAAAENSLTYRFLLQDVSRCLKHSLTGTNLNDALPASDDESVFVHFQDYIPRHSSASTVVVQGVRENKPPGQTTMWTILGFQLCSVAVPTRVAAGPNLPNILTADETGNAPLCDWALALKRRCFPIQRGSGKKYLNLSAVINRLGTGVLQQLHPVEDRIFSEFESVVASSDMRDEENNRAFQKFYEWVDEFLTAEYGKLLDP